jgi:glycosyltransferase involved in cell wall biosynthesis
MNILFIINQLSVGGAEEQLVVLCEGLRKRGHEVHVVSIYDDLDLRSRLDAIQVPIRVAHKYSKVDLTIVWRLRRLIREVDPDLVHAYLPAASLFTAMTKWTGISVPILVGERNVNDWRSRWRIWLDNIVRRRVAVITCNAEAIKKHLIDREHVSADQIVVIPNGLGQGRRTRPDEAVIDRARREINAPPGSFVVISVANFTQRKRHDILLSAFSKARDAVTNLFLVLVGKGAMEQDIRGMIERLRLGDCSQIISSCMNPVPLLCVSNAAILTSDIEGFPNALLEAMAMGLPIVASDVGGNPELVVPGRGGFICAAYDVRAFETALVRLARDSPLAREMGQYNRERAREFTDDIMVERTEALYWHVLTAGGQWCGEKPA